MEEEKKVVEAEVEPVPEKKEEVVPPEPKKEAVAKPKIRQIVIETDGNNINLTKAEVSGALEFIKVMEQLIANAPKLFSNK